jgi:Elongation complex protein 6
VLVEEGNFAQGDFVIYSLLELYLRSAHKVVFIASSQSFAHYAAVMKKLVATR